ncbi:MAG: hypothetical protein H3C68_04550 [Deltaproteobacteria bacterium]|nr:hypothetical protein [Deltaproteobacteria bacterium]MBZ0219996.1 hypothetical protein [Deltaproteobacteria bacterium]
MIKRMLKVRIIGPKSRIDEAVKALHSAAVLHIETVPEEDIRNGGLIRRLPIEAERIREKEELERARETLASLTALVPPPPVVRPARVEARMIPRYMGDLAHIGERARELRARKDSLSEELSSIGKYEKLLRGFAPIVSRLGGLKNFEIAGITLERTREDIAGLLESEVSRITDGVYRMLMRDLDPETIGVVLAYPKHFDPQVKSLLAGRAISEVRLPDEYADMALVEALMRMERRRAQIPGLIRDIDRELSTIGFQWYDEIAGTARAVDNALDEFGALSYAAASSFAFIIEGWVPAERYGDLLREFRAAFVESVRISTIETGAAQDDSVPVLIRNPWFIRPFEVFLSALPPPRYGSVDPTIYVAIFFPAFFGLIVADMGYGAVTMVLALFIRSRFKGMKAYRDIATVLAIASGSAIVFGFLFGEFFGDLGERLGLHPILFHRIEALTTLIYVTIGIGVFHVLLGIALGIKSSITRKKTKKAGARAAFFVLVVSFLWVLGSLSGYLPGEYLPIAAAVSALSFIALVVLEGILGPVDFLEALGNIISYVRIMAVGTASVVMALVANRLGSLPESMAIGIAIAGLMHLLNLLLSILSPSIQSMRLQYVEFFSKFYEGGGRKYRPFRRR